MPTRVAKIFKQPLELIPCARITEYTETINIAMMGWDNGGKAAGVLLPLPLPLLLPGK